MLRTSLWHFVDVEQYLFELLYIMTSLCEYCSLIDFEYLRAPTVEDLERINAGDPDVYGRFPFKADTSDQVGATWRLGRQSRVVESANTCRLCETIVKVLAESNLPKENAMLFHSDPICEARSMWSARLSPPSGGISYQKKDGSSLPIFYLRRLSLRWIEAVDSMQEIGEVLLATDDPSHMSATLGAALQPCDQDSYVEIDQLFDDSLLGQDRTYSDG